MSSPTLPRHRPRPSALRSVPALVDPVPQEHDDCAQALRTEIEQLRTAMASRAGIEQAKGVLMLLTGCNEQAAFELLTHISSNTHRKVRDIASELVASACGRTPLPSDVGAILRDACPPSTPPH